MLSHGEAVRALRAGRRKGAARHHPQLFPGLPGQRERRGCRAARKADAFSNRWFLDPIFKGQYPEDLLEMLGDLSAASMMPTLPIISVPIDFLGVNYYTRQVVRHDPRAQWRCGHLHPAPSTPRWSGRSFRRGSMTC